MLTVVVASTILAGLIWVVAQTRIVDESPRPREPAVVGVPVDP